MSPSLRRFQQLTLNRWPACALLLVSASSRRCHPVRFDIIKLSVIQPFIIPGTKMTAILGDTNPDPEEVAHRAWLRRRLDEGGSFCCLNPDQAGHTQKTRLNNVAPSLRNGVIFP
jgi:hypothetical protein